MNQGFGKDFYRKGNSVKRFGPFTEPRRTLKTENCCPHPLPENRLLPFLLPIKEMSVELRPACRDWLGSCCQGHANARATTSV